MIKSTLCYIEKEGKYLMMFRGKKPNDPNAGKWIGIGGKFKEGETADECMLRKGQVFPGNVSALLGLSAGPLV